MNDETLSREPRQGTLVKFDLIVEMLGFCCKGHFFFQIFG